jgi:hypothetical protein
VGVGDLFDSGDACDEGVRGRALLARAGVPPIVCEFPLRWLKAGTGARTPRLREVESALEGTFFGLDFFLELQNAEEHGFGAWRAAWDVNVHRDDLVATLHDGIVVEDAAGGGAGSHGNDPLGFWHLIVELADHGSHFHRKTPGHDHQVGLTRRGTENFGAEAGDVETRGGHGHHFDGAASEAEAERPDGTFARPIHGFIELREDNAFVLEEFTEVVGFSESDALSEGGFHGGLPFIFA